MLSTMHVLYSTQAEEDANILAHLCYVHMYIVVEEQD